jgi:SSS family solute:Na+ symporter
LAIDILPEGAFGLFMTGIIATLMSTIDSLGLVSAITFGRDILWRIQGDHNDSGTVPFIKKGLVIISFLSLILAYLIPSIVQLFYTIGSILIPGLILPFLNTLRKEGLSMNSMDAVRWMAIPIIISVGWYAISAILGMPFLGIEPFYPGMLVSVSYLLWHEIRSKRGS